MVKNTNSAQIIKEPLKVDSSENWITELNDKILIAMYIETDRIIYSPSDLTLYMDSPFASWMEHSVLINPELLSSADAPDELMSLLQKKGALHEDEVLKSDILNNLGLVSEKL